MVNPSICRQTRHYPFTDAFKVMHRSRHLRAAAGHSTRHHDVLIISLISSRFLSGLIYRRFVVVCFCTFVMFTNVLFTPIHRVPYAKAQYAYIHQHTQTTANRVAAGYQRLRWHYWLSRTVIDPRCAEIQQCHALDFVCFIDLINNCNYGRWCVLSTLLRDKRGKCEFALHTCEIIVETRDTVKYLIADIHS